MALDSPLALPLITVRLLLIVPVLIDSLVSPCEILVVRILIIVVFLDYSSNVAKKAEVKFDWAKFWSYLKPHLIKFLSAICVRNDNWRWEDLINIYLQAALAVAYFNIKIPELLGVFVNSLTKYARAGERIFETSDFLQDMKGPAVNLFGMYILQVNSF